MTAVNWADALPRPGNQRFKQLKPASPWFELYQLNAGTLTFLEPNHEEQVISYLVLGTEKAVLIDTGMGISDIKAEVERLTDLPVIVVNTHSHLDHVGDDHRFAEVWAYDNDSEVARIERGQTHAECEMFIGPDSYRNLPSGFDPLAYEIHPSPVTRRLSHREVIDLGARRLTVHHTPGHSPGSICLLDNRDGLLFTGDTFYPDTLYAHLEGSDFAAYSKSVEYLVTLLDQINHLCPAHCGAYAPKEMLPRVLDAFSQIIGGQVPFELIEETRVYQFERFGVRLPASSRGSRVGILK